MIELNPEFLLTPLREGRRVERYQVRFRCGFLLTPLREGRLDDFLKFFAEKVQISTHAPAGGATECGRSADARLRISTHAPAGGATVIATPNAAVLANFYSRPCGRGDLNWMFSPLVW